MGVLDHRPINLEFKQKANLGPIPFRFSPLWTQHQDFLERACSIWTQRVTGSPFIVWEEKLRRVKRELKIWSRGLTPPFEERKEVQNLMESHQLALEIDKVTKEALCREEVL